MYFAGPNSVTAEGIVRGVWTNLSPFLPLVKVTVAGGGGLAADVGGLESAGFDVDSCLDSLVALDVYGFEMVFTNGFRVSVGF